MGIKGIWTFLSDIFPALKYRRLWKYKFLKFEFVFLFIVAVCMLILIHRNFDIPISIEQGCCLKNIPYNIVITSRILAFIIIVPIGIFLLWYVFGSKHYPRRNHNKIIEHYEKMIRTNPVMLMEEITDCYEIDIEKQIDNINKEYENYIPPVTKMEEDEEVEKAYKRGARLRNITAIVMGKILMNKEFIQKSIDTDPVFCLNFFSRLTTTRYYDDRIEYYFSQLIESKYLAFVNELLDIDFTDTATTFENKINSTQFLKLIFNKNCTATLFKTNKLFGDAASKEIHSNCQIFSSEESVGTANEYEYKRTICYQYIKYWLCSFMYIHQDFMRNKDDGVFKDIYPEYLNHLTYDMIDVYGKFGNNTYAHKFTDDVSNMIRNAVNFLKVNDNSDKLLILIDERLTITYSKCGETAFDYSKESLQNAFEEYISLDSNNSKWADIYLEYLMKNYEIHKQIYKDALPLVFSRMQEKEAYKRLQELIK